MTTERADSTSGSGRSRRIAWGVSASATSWEGAAPASDWARWERLGLVPTSGEGNGFGTNFTDDLALLGSHDLTTLRLGIDWARIEPLEGRVDGGSIEHYRRILEAAREAGVGIWACLHDQTSPGWFGDDLGGFADERARSYHWPRHVDRVAEHLGDLVAGWVPIADPLGWARRGHLTGAGPPGSRDPKAALDASAGALRGVLSSWELLRGTPQPVATSFVVSPLHAAPSDDDPTTVVAAGRHRDFLDATMWDCWIRLLRDGVLALPDRPDVALPQAVDAFDVIGIGYRHGATVDEHGSAGPYPRDRAVGPDGHVAWAEGLAHVLDRVSTDLPGRRYVIDGLGVPTSPEEANGDERRCEFMEEAAAVVADAVRGGVQVDGLLWQSGIDGYEWRAGYDIELGLFDRDRRPRPSAALAARYASTS